MWHAFLSISVFLSALACSEPPSVPASVQIESASGRVQSLVANMTDEPTVVFVVLDTVRSDHLSLCGYARPTTPVLDELAASGASYTCDAYSPGSWTLPSHASFFTGVDPLEHGTHAITSGVDDFSGHQVRMRGFRWKKPTLAGRMAKRGYQTVAVSANPVVSGKSKLLRGHDVEKVAPKWGKLFGKDFLPAVRETLAPLDQEEPLFLFANIADAHRPWKRVRKDHTWLPEAASINYDKTDEESEWRRFVEGRMSQEEAAAFSQQVQALYDAAISRADANLGALLDMLIEDGWCARGCRIVVTSDHGEMLGEHQLLDHGHYVWDSNVQVPLMLIDRDPVPLEGPVSALEAHHLVRRGKAEGLEVTSMAWPHVRRCARTSGKAFCSTSVALLRGDEKLIYSEGSVSRFDRSVDPWEIHPLPVAKKDPLRARLIELGERAELDEKGESDADVMEQLRALGYAE